MSKGLFLEIKQLLSVSLYITDGTLANFILRSYRCKRVVIIEQTNNLKFFMNYQHFSLTFIAHTCTRASHVNNGSRAQQLDITFLKNAGYHSG